MKSKRLLTIISVAFIIIVAIPSQGLTFSKEMHETINGNIGQRTINGFSLNDYLLNQLGFKDGVFEPLYGYSGKFNKDFTQRVWQWLGEGGFKEDEPEELWRLLSNIARNNNHFHRKLKVGVTSSYVIIFLTRMHISVWCTYGQVAPDRLPGYVLPRAVPWK